MSDTLRAGDRVRCILASRATDLDGELYLVEGDAYIVNDVARTMQTKYGPCTLVSLARLDGEPAGHWGSFRFRRVEL